VKRGVVRAVGFGVFTVTASAMGAQTEGPGPSPATHVLAGELTRLDLAARAIVLKTEGKDGREVQTSTTPETRLSVRGRAAALEELRPGDRVAVVCADAGGRHRALEVRVAGRPWPPLRLD
jgi:hypothetical protein